MALIKFYRGNKAKYDELAHQDGIYFALDTKEIIVNGDSFGYCAEDHKEIQEVEYTAPDTIVITYTDGTSSTVVLQTAEAGESVEDSKAGIISAEEIYKLSKIEAEAQVNVIETVKVNNVPLTPDADKAVNIDLSDVNDSIAKNKVTAADNSVTVTPGSGSGDSAEPTKVAVKIKNGGSLNVTDEGLEVDQAALTKYVGDNKAIEVGEADSNNTKTVGLKLNSHEGNILTATADGLFSTVKIKKLDVPETDSTVASRYGLVGLQPDGTEINVGDVTIDILKDKYLKNVSLGQIPEGQPNAGDDALVFVFNISDGTEITQYVNVSTFLREAEAGNGIEIKDGKYIIKLDTANIEKNSQSEAYLQLGENGLKLVGINAEIAAAKTEVVAKADGHITVAVTTEADGHQKVTISEDGTIDDLVEKVKKLTEEPDLTKDWAEPDNEDFDNSEDEDWADFGGDWDYPEN